MTTINNRVQLIGNLGATPEVKSFDGGNKVARFSVATSDNYTNKKGEKVTNTNWHNIVAWGKLADVAADLFQKGSQVSIDGKLTTRNYTDKAGVKKYITEVVANELLLIDKNNN